MPRDIPDIAPHLPAETLDELIACPHCDALYHARVPEPGHKATCLRCHTVLISSKRDTYGRVVALALTQVILMIGAIFFPFLGVNVAGFSNSASVLDAALTFMGRGWLSAVSVLVAAFIVMVPALRSVLVIYALAPLAAGRPALAGARHAFGLSEDLRTWSMPEIFIIGTAVALTKIADLAKIEFGPAFWMFAVLVVVIAVKDANLDRWSIWKTLGETA